MEDIKTFDYCISDSIGKRHLVLGNGFSVDLFPDIFNYRRLAEKITDVNIRAVFEEFNTSDFEFVVLKLTESLKVINHYDVNKEVYDKVYEDAEKLKRILIQVITDSHPSNPNEILDSQYKSCFEFLNHFRDGRKYTFNYDLLLYWVFMHFLDNQEITLSMDDGFRTDWSDDSMVTWEIGREHNQTLYYIHGAMHIFKSKNAVIEKYTWRNKNKTIAQQVKDSIEQDKFPLFISEGTTEHKLKRIKENGYLSRAFSSLKGITGNLFVFGHSIRDEDDHFFSIINSNRKINKIYISIYGDQNSDYNKIVLGKIKRWRSEYLFKGREYIVYDSNSANVWNRYEI